MAAPLDDLIARLTRVVNDPEQRTLMFHWSDVELLRDLQRELARHEHQLGVARDAALISHHRLINKDHLP